MFWATFSFFGLGGVTSHGAGIVIWVGNPIFMPMAVSYFAGLGNVMFVGGGSAVLVGSPVAMPMALAVRTYIHTHGRTDGRGSAWPILLVSLPAFPS